MKRFITISLLACLVCGCHTPPVNIAVTTSASVETLVEAARGAFIQYENDCHCVTVSQDAQLKAAYEKYQAASQVAHDALVAYVKVSEPDASLLSNVQSLAASADTFASDLIGLVEQFLPPDKSTTLKTKITTLKGHKK